MIVLTRLRARWRRGRAKPQLQFVVRRSRKERIRRKVLQSAARITRAVVISVLIAVIIYITWQHLLPEWRAGR